jgi:DNA-binding NtrC family response regulator
MNNSGAGAKRILVVEDEPGISLVCSKILTSEVVKVDIAHDGEMAEEMLQRKDYALCIIDLKTLMTKDKQLHQYMNRKYPELLNGAIFTAPGVVAGDSKDFIGQTARLFLHKPFAPEWLKELVGKTLGQVNNEDYRTNKTAYR